MTRDDELARAVAETGTRQSATGRSNDVELAVEAIPADETRARGVVVIFRQIDAGAAA